MKIVFETERLRLREYTLEDFDFIIKLLNSAGWLKYIGDRNIKTREQAIQYLENVPLKSYQDFGYGLSMVELRESGIPIGMCGILNRSNLEDPDIGFALLPEYNGKGYAFEIANATIKHAREVLNLKVLSAITDPDNIASIKLLEKLGFKFVKKFIYTGSNEELTLYKIEL